MCSILQALLSWQFIVFGLVAIALILGIVLLTRKYTTILGGIIQLLQSPSGVFGILTLGAITVVTWHQPSVGGAAFAAFVGIVPAILAFCEHKETMAQMTQLSPPLPPPVPALLPSIPPPPPDPNLAKPVVGSPDAPVA